MRTLAAGGLVMSSKAAATLLHADNALGAWTATNAEVARIDTRSWP
ncbi:hypothetical protein [Nocardia sp. CA-135398]